MKQKIEEEIYSRINIHMLAYIEAANNKAAPEELHHKLRDLLEEAIKVNIPLKKLLQVFSDSTLARSEKSDFIDNVVKQYSYGEDAAEVKHELASKREKKLVQS